MRKHIVFTNKHTHKQPNVYCYLHRRTCESEISVVYGLLFLRRTIRPKVFNYVQQTSHREPSRAPPWIRPRMWHTQTVQRCPTTLQVSLLTCSSEVPSLCARKRSFSCRSRMTSCSCIAPAAADIPCPAPAPSAVASSSCTCERHSMHARV